MGDILINTLALLLIIVLGFLLKRWNILSKADGSRLSLIILNVTLPAAVITNLAALKIELALLFLIMLGLGFNLLMVAVGHYFSKKEPLSHKKFMMYSVSGYNIGNFAMPFTQAFLPAAIPLLALFDVGNSIMLAGGTTVAIDLLTGAKDEVSLKKITKRLGSSPIFITYMVMLVLRLLAVELPEAVLAVTGIAGNANTFLSMFMIGLYLDLYLPRHTGKVIAKVLGVRYAFGILMALVIYLLPLPSLLTLALCLLCVGPIATFGVINSVAAGMAEEAVGFASSISFLLSFGLMTLVLLLLT